MYEIAITLPLNNVLPISKIGNICIGDKYKDGIVTNMNLLTSYTRPGLATLHISCIDDKNCRFTSKYEMIYSTEVYDITLGRAILRLSFIDDKKKDEDTDVWYSLNSTLAKEILNGNLT